LANRRESGVRSALDANGGIRVLFAAYFDVGEQILRSEFAGGTPLNLSIGPDCTHDD
jgi:hypothetical protein